MNNNSSLKRILTLDKIERAKLEAEAQKQRASEPPKKSLFNALKGVFITKKGK